MGFPKAPRANLGAWSMGVPASIAGPQARTQTRQVPQARKNAWSRPAPWANLCRTPAAPIVAGAPSVPKPVATPVEVRPISNGIPALEPIVYGLAPVEVPTSPVEFIKVARSPEPVLAPPVLQPKPEGRKPAAIVTSFRMPKPETQVEPKSWTVTVEEVNWFEANEEVAVVASPEPPSPAPSNDSSPEPAESAWTTVAKRSGNKRWQRASSNERLSPAGNGRSSPRVRSSPGPNPRGYGYHNRGQKQRTSHHQHGSRHQGMPQGMHRGHRVGETRSFRHRPIWKKVGSADSLGSGHRIPSRQPSGDLSFPARSPTPSSISDTSFARADSGSSQTLSCETSSSSPAAPAMEPCPPRRSDPQVATVLKKMESLGTGKAAWADEDEEMDW